MAFSILGDVLHFKVAALGTAVFIGIALGFSRGIKWPAAVILCFLASTPGSSLKYLSLSGSWFCCDNHRILMTFVFLLKNKMKQRTAPQNNK